MTVRLSTGFRNLLAQGMGFGAILNRGTIGIYTGSQPATADAAATGTLLGTVSASSGAVTKETRATGSITLTGGSSGSVNTVTVGGLNIIPDGAVSFNTSLAQTASDLCDAINRNGIMMASVSSATVTIMGRYGTGVTTAAVSSTLTTITASYVNMGSGIAGVAPVNGLILGVPAAGVIAKPSNQVWSFNGIATGTAGWFRFYSSDNNDSGAVISTPLFPRLDGSVGVSGADLNLSSISIVPLMPVTIDTFQWTQPAS